MALAGQGDDRRAAAMLGQLAFADEAGGGRPSIRGICTSIRIRSHSPPSQAGHRVDPVADHHRLDADLGQQRLQHQLVDRIVLRRQHPHAGVAVRPTRGPADAAACRGGAALRAGRSPRGSGRVTTKVEPSPSALFASIRPPISSASSRQMASPRPGAAVPPGGRGVGLGELLEQRRLLGRAMPMPVSATVRVSTPPRRPTRTDTRPAR